MDMQTDLSRKKLCRIFQETGLEFGEEEKDLILKQREKSHRDMYLAMVNECAVSLKDLIKVNSSTSSKVVHDEAFAQWIGSKFLVAYAIVKAGDLAGLNKKEVVEFLKKLGGQQLTKNINGFLKQASNSGLQFFKDEAAVQQICEEFANSKEWNQMNEYFDGLRNKSGNAEQFLKKQEQEERKTVLEDLYNTLKGLQKETVDYLVQQNLVESFRYPTSYSNQKYESFIKELTIRCNKLGINNHQLQSQINIGLGQNQSYYNKIISLRSKIHPIYIPDLLNLLEKNKQAQKVVQGADIIVILGVSGAGKSTAIQMMLGYNLILRKKQGQLTTLVTSKPLKAEHKQFIAKASSKSVTKYVSAIEWKITKSSYREFDGIKLADTPGFFDSGGLIVDASNGLSTIRTLQKANSIRFIFLINYKVWGLRGEGFKKLASLISKLFKKYDSKSVIYFLNCISQQDLKELPAKIKDISEQLNELERGDQKFVYVVEHFKQLVEQAQEISKNKKISMSEAIKSVPQLLVMDPLKPNLDQIYKKVLNEQRVISRPKQILANILTQEARQALRLQTFNIETIIKKQIKNDNMQRVKYFINLLSRLANETKEVGDVAHAQKSIESLKKDFKQNLKTLLSEFNQIFNRRAKSLRIDQSDFEKAKELQLKLKDLQTYYNEVFNSNNQQLSFTNSVKQTKNQTKEFLLQKLKNGKSKELFETIILFSKYFSSQLHSLFIQSMRKDKKQLEDKIIQSIKNEKFDNIGSLVFQYQENCALFKNLKNLRQAFELGSPSSKWKGQLQAKIQNFKAKFEKIKSKNCGQKGYVQDFKDEDVDDIVKILNKLRIVEISKNQTIAKISQTYKTLQKDIFKVARSYIALIRNFVKSDMSQVNIVTSVKKAKNNALKLIEKISEIKEDIQIELNYELRGLSEQISAKTNSIEVEKVKIRDDWSPLKGIYLSICFLRKLSQVCDEQEGKKCRESILTTEEEIVAELEKVNTQIMGLTLSLDTNQNIMKILKLYNINVGKKGLDGDGPDPIFNNCIEIKDTIRKKLKRIVQQIDNFVKESSEQHQKKNDNFESWIPKICKIIQFFDNIKSTIFSPEEINELIYKSRDNFIKFCKETIHSIKQEITSQTQEILKMMENFESASLLNKQKIRLINKRRNTLTRVITNSSIMWVYENDVIIMNDWQNDVNERIKQIYDTMENMFQVLQKSSLKKCFDFVKFCGQLAMLDNLKTTLDLSFKSQLLKYKDLLEKNAKTQLLFTDPKDFICDGKIDLIRFKKSFTFYSKFKKDSQEDKTIRNILDSIKYQIKQDEKNLYRELKSNTTSKNKNLAIDDTSAIDKIYERIQSILSVTKQLSQIIQMGQNPDERGRWVAPEIAVQTKKKIQSYSNKILQNLVKKIRQKIAQGSQGYEEAETLIGKVSYMYDLFDSVKQVKEVLEGREKQKLSLSEQLSQELKETIDKRRNKYFNIQKQIVIGEDFGQDLNTFSLSDQDKIKDRISKQFKKEIQKIVKGSKKQTGYSLKCKYQKLVNETENLVPSWRKQVKDAIDEIYNKELEERRLGIEQAQSNFKFENAYDLLNSEDINPEVKQAYKRKLQEYFEAERNKLAQNTTISQKIKLLQVLFVKSVNGKNIEAITQYKVIYAKFLNFATEIMKQRIRSKIKNLQTLIGKKYLTETSKADETIATLENEIRQLKDFWQFSRKNLQIFSKLQQIKQEQMRQFFKISDNYYEKNLSKTRQMRNENIRDDPNVLVVWKYDYQIYMVLTEILESLTEILEPIIHFISHFYISSNEIKKMQERRKQLLYKWQQIQKTPKQLLTQLGRLKFYSESMRNKSENQRQKVFKQAHQDFKILTAYSETKLFKNLDQQIKKLKDEKLAQINNGIEKSCQLVQTAFKSTEVEFNKQINVTLSIVKSINKKMAFLKIEGQKKKQLGKKIDQMWRQRIQKMDETFTKILQESHQTNQSIKALRESNIQKLHELEKKQDGEFKDYSRTSKIQLQTSLKAENDEQKKQMLKRKSLNELTQKERQSKEKIQKLALDNKTTQEKEQKVNEGKLNEHFQTYCQIMLILYKCSQELNAKQEQRKIDFNLKLKENRKALGKRIFNQIYEILKKKQNNYANLLINSHEVFKNNQAIKWEAKVVGRGIDYVLEGLKLQANRRKELKLMFESYQYQFKQWIKQYQKCPNISTIERLLTDIKNKAITLQAFYHKNGPSAKCSSEKLLAGIFALWTIINSDIEQGIVQFYYQPHPAQIVSIFLCLSFLKNENPKTLNSKMAQIRTGEGKSVVLAGISAYLALCEFQVNTVCYSQYLSSRDRQNFAKLFDKLGVLDKIRYGTFENVCQSLLSKKNSQQKGLRDQVRQILQQQNSNQGTISSFISSPFQTLKKKFVKIFSFQNLFKNQKNENRKIMLIDQVDVFFDPSFFGSLYCPDVSLTSDQIRKLLEKVWFQYKKNSKITEKMLIETQQYKNVKNRYKKIKEILENQLNGMILGCRGSNHDYVVRDGLIQYKNQDGISSKINYGFQTLYAYLKQMDKQRISNDSLKNALKISLIIAQFSYAILPLYFKSIIGVTGTYEDMPNFKKDYMKNKYGVKEYYVIPSIYGNEKERRKINPPKIIQADKHWKQVIEEINSVHLTGRPVLVFFKSSLELDSFFTYPDFQPFQKKTTFLNQTHSENDRCYRIQQSCNKNKITLMTNSFGRGTDFIVSDQSINQIGHGGVHVIQTFLSVELSQQIQIQGRTARQGNPGSYSLIINIQQLEKLQLPQNQATIDKFEDELKKARQKIEVNQQIQHVKRLNQAEDKHKKCVQIYKNQNTNEDNLIQFIKSLNGYQSITNQTCKTIIMIDGTGSMGALIKKLLSILGEVVKDVIEITGKQTNVSVSELQICVYRNYSCPYQTVFQSTPFETSANNLINFMKNINTEGGWGRQAIELGYWHVNKIENLDQAIIIGDAPANKPEETKQKRKYKGQDYWDSKNIPLLSSQEQLQKIIKKKIPIHSFYIQNHYEAKKYFQQVSKKTSGKAQQFHIDAYDSSKKLSQFIAQNILQKVTKDEDRRKKMVEQYRKRHSL